MRDRTRRRPKWRRQLLAGAISVVVVGAGHAARAAGAEADGVYGRFDGDVSLALQAGVSAAFPGESVTGRLSAHYLHTVGLWGQYQDSLGVGGQPIARSVARSGKGHARRSRSGESVLAEPCHHGIEIRGNVPQLLGEVGHQRAAGIHRPLPVVHGHGQQLGLCFRDLYRSCSFRLFEYFHGVHPVRTMDDQV